MQAFITEERTSRCEDFLQRKRMDDKWECTGRYRRQV